MAFQTTSDLLSEIAIDYLNNGDDLSGAGRKIEIKDNLVVEFNNKASQGIQGGLRTLGVRYKSVCSNKSLSYQVVIPYSIE